MGKVAKPPSVHWIGNRICAAGRSVGPLHPSASMGSVQALHAQLDQQLRAMFLSFHWSEWTTLCLAAGVCEELLFRGLIQQGISESGWFGIGVMNGVFAIAVGSLLFGLCHFLSWTYFFFATLFGTYFGLCFVWTGDLLVAMVAHSVYDMIILAWLLRSFQKSSAIDR